MHLPLKPLIKLLLIFFCCLSTFVVTTAQVKPPFIPRNSKLPFLNIYRLDTAGGGSQFTSAAAIMARQPKTATTAADATTCTTTTFYMHIPAPQNGKISIQAVKVTLAGDYVVAGSISDAGGNNAQGIIMRVDNAGNITSQQTITTQNRSTRILSADVLPDGNILIAGLIQGGPFNVFVASVSPQLTTNWLQTFNSKQPVSNITAHVTGPGQFAVAMQQTTSATCLLLMSNGAQVWNRTVSPPGFSSIASFIDMPDGTIGLLSNCIQNGKRTTQLTALQNTNGEAALSTIVTGSEESYFLAGTNYNSRLSVLRIIKTGKDYRLARENLYSANTIETHQTYALGEPVDFTASGQMDNSGDLMGICLPTQEKLLIIKHYNYYQTSVEYTKTLTVPKAVGIAGVARSFDGGFLFGLNTKDSSEILLIKTDSIGKLGGCASPVAVSNVLTEAYQIPNNPVAGNTLLAGVFGTVQSAAYNTPALTARFDCRENYCPEPPLEDTCVDTYFKLYNSHAYADVTSQYFLMPGNEQIRVTGRYERVFGNINTVTPTIQLFDKNGHFKKGIILTSNGEPVNVEVRKVDDNHLLLQSYDGSNGATYTFTLMTADLQLLWSKSITITSVGGSSDGSASQDWIKDDEGNYYFITCHPGFNSPSQAFIYKMDASGNNIWTKGYSFSQQSFESVSAVATKSSVVLIMEGFGGSSGTLQVNKKTGTAQNAYTFQQSPETVIFHRFAQFYNGRIYYKGNGPAGSLVVGIFDTTGKPVKFKNIPAAEGTRSTAFSKGMFYVTSYHYDANQNLGDAMVVIDSNLNLQSATAFPYYRYTSGIGVDEKGYVYAGGNLFNEQDVTSYLAKYDANGKSGICGVPFTNIVVNDMNPQTQLNSVSEVTPGVTPANITISSIPFADGLQIGSILCSSNSNCNAIKLAGPGAVCRLNTAYTYSIKKNAACTLTPVWQYDTAYATLEKFTDTSITFSYKKPGSIQLKATINGGCNVYSDSITVNIQKQASTLSLGPDTALCPHDSLLLIAGAGFSTYTWQDGTHDSVYRVKQAGKYFVQVSNTCGEKYGDTVIISSVTVPALSIGNDTAICLKDTVQLQAAAGFATYTWKPQVSTTGRYATFIPQQAETITIQAKTTEGCPAADTVNITVKQARPVTLGNDTSFCYGDSVVLSAGDNYTSYQWNDGTKGQRLTAYLAGSYWVKAQDANGCYAYDTMRVSNVYSLPQVKLGSAVAICAGTKRLLDAGQFARYAWQDGSTGRYFNAWETGRYTVQVTDNNGCLGSDSTAITNVLPLPANFLKTTDSLCQYDKLTLAATGDFSRYLWGDGSTMPSIVIDKPGAYTLTVTANNGCTGSDTITVAQKICMYGFYVPNAFTPNGDGTNDVFSPKLFGNIQHYLFCIYDRFGEMVFKTSTPGQAWDGSYKGKPFDAGTTFVWRCQYQLQGDKLTDAKGTVVLIK